jgi:protein-tyrosine phosphatase
MAERMTRGALAVRLGPGAASLQVMSAGTRGWEGEPMDRLAHVVLAERSADPAGFVARQLTPEMVAAADLILCASRAHRSEVVGLDPRSLRRAFTIREIGRLVAGVEPAEISRAGVRETGSAFGERATARRGLNRPADPADDDIADPYGQGVDAFHACADLIARSLRGPIDLLTAALWTPSGHET